MKRTLIFATLAAMFAISCQKDFNGQNHALEEELKANPYAISEDEAIKALEEFMSVFDEDGTRSKERKVQRVTPVKYEDISPITRGGENVDIENLLYIVEFEEGCGCAVVGADCRVEPIYTILDESSFEYSDFINGAGNCDATDIKSFTAGLIVNNAINDISTYSLLPEVDLNPDLYDYVSETQRLNYIPPLILTKWDQVAPYNDKFTITNDNSLYYYKPYAGCTTIAIGQLLTNLSVTPSITLNGRTHLFSEVGQFYHDNDEAYEDTYLLQKLGNFIYDLATEMHPTYTPSGTSINHFYGMAQLRQAGLSNVLISDIDRNKINEMLSENKPIWISGADDNGTTSTSDDYRHSWLIDGRRQTQTTVYKVTIRNGAVVARELYDTYLEDYVHCNFGWGGDCDGYYNYSVFNVSTRRSSGLIESEYGDIIYTKDRVYDYDLEMIKYNL